MSVLDTGPESITSLLDLSDSNSKISVPSPTGKIEELTTSVAG